MLYDPAGIGTTLQLTFLLQVIYASSPVVCCAARRPPAALVEQLQALDAQFHIGHRLRSSRDPG